MEGNTLGRLRAAYEVAFQQWERQVHLLQEVTSNSSSDSPAVQEARRRVVDAQVAYREARDSLAAFIMARTSKPVSKDGGRHPEGAREGGVDLGCQVERLAHLLWEMAGRPSGTAETDWQRAEQLIFSRGQ